MLLILTHKLILPSSHIPASSYTTICSTSVVQSCNRVLETATASGRHKTGLFFVVTCLILHIGRKNLQLLSTFSQGKEHVQCVHVTLPSFYFHGSNLTSADHGKICFWVWAAQGVAHGMRGPNVIPTSPTGVQNWSRCATCSDTRSQKH